MKKPTTLSADEFAGVRTMTPDEFASGDSTLGDIGDTGTIAAGGFAQGLNEGLNPLKVLSGLATMGQALSRAFPGFNVAADTSTPIIKSIDEASKFTQPADFMKNFPVAGDALKFVESITGPTPRTAEETAKKIGAEMTPLRKAISTGTRTAGTVLALGGRPLPSTLTGVGSALGQAVGGETGSLIGSVFTPIITGRIIRGVRGEKPPTIEELRTKAQESYRTAESAGVMIGPNATRTLAVDTASDMARQGLSGGAAEKLYPRATAVMQLVAEETAGPMTLEKAERLRRVMNDAIKGADAADARLVSRMKTRLDRTVSGLGKADIIAGDIKTAVPALTDARANWSKMAKAETIENLMERAQLSAGKFTGSGLENAIRTEFRNFAKRKREMSLFTPDEQAAIRRVAEGSLTSNILRNAGRFAIRGPVSGGLGLGAAAVDPVLGFSLAATGELGRQGATMMTKSAARNASELMRRGFKYTQPLSKIELDMIRSAVTAAGAGAVQN